MKKNIENLVNNPVFLVGAERSGSTMLRLMLHNHPKLVWLNEFEYAFDKVTDSGIYPKLDDYYTWLETHRVFQATGFGINKSLDYPSLIRSFLEQKLNSAEPKYIGATVHRYFDRILYLWPDSKFIHLVRDGRDVALSNIKMGWAGNVYMGVDKWNEAELLWTKMEDKLPNDRYLNVKYEQLAIAPQRELNNICRFLGIDYSETMMTYNSVSTYNPPSQKFVQNWKNSLSITQVRLIESKVSDSLLSNGYDLSGQPIYAPNKIFKIYLFMQNRLYRTLFRIKRYGCKLYILDFFSRHLRFNNLQRKIKLKLNEIDTSLLK